MELLFCVDDSPPRELKAITNPSGLELLICVDDVFPRELKAITNPPGLELLIPDELVDDVFPRELKGSTNPGGLELLVPADELEDDDSVGELLDIKQTSEPPSQVFVKQISRDDILSLSGSMIIVAAQEYNFPSKKS